MEKEAFKQYMSETDNWLHKGRRLLLNTCLHLSRQTAATHENPLRILEVGAGSGKNIETLAEFGLVDAIEIEKLGLEQLSENPHVQEIITSKVPFSLEKKYDIICAMDFLEHVENDKEVFDWMVGCLETNGILFLTVPAYQFLFSSHDIALNHYRRYTTAGLIRLNEGQLTLIKRGYFNSLLFPLAATSRILKRMLPNKGKGTEKQSSSVHPLLGKLFFSALRSEINLIRKYPLFPFGLTAFTLFRKDETKTLD